MRDFPKFLASVCIIGLWLMSVLGLSAAFGVLMASSINGGIVW